MVDKQILNIFILNLIKIQKYHQKPLQRWILL